jgi:hypothetical protein
MYHKWFLTVYVIPAKAGIQNSSGLWIPASAGMTAKTD